MSEAIASGAIFVIPNSNAPKATSVASSNRVKRIEGNQQEERTGRILLG
jgi:hypothetical protein